ncbi:Dot/Icm T4SS effector Lem29 [Legionella pneumophila serogroup 1]
MYKICTCNQSFPNHYRVKVLRFCELICLEYKVGLEKKIKLSQRSLELLNDYLNLGGSGPSNLVNGSSSIDFSSLTQLLASNLSKSSKTSKTIKKKREFIEAALYAELLRDLSTSLNGSDEEIKPAEKEPPVSNKLKFWLLAIAGTLLAACEGFDSITTMMAVLSFPAWVVLCAGILFSALSVVVFYGFDLVQVSQNLEIKLTDTPKLLDLYLSQMEEIKAIRKKIDNYSLASMSMDELNELHLILVMLQDRVNSLVKAGQKFDLALNSPKMDVAKTIVSGVSGILFFGGGFFAGQSVATFMLALVMTSVTPTFWPVLLFSVIVGLAAFSLYWYVQRVGVNKLVSEWFGLDEDKIEKLCGKSKMDKELKKLNNLDEKVMTTSDLLSKVANLESKLIDIGKQMKEMSAHQAPEKKLGSATGLKASSNVYSFHFNSSNRDQESVYGERVLDDAVSDYGRGQSHNDSIHSLC